MNKEIKIAYFSAEIGINENIKTYSGELGILAGDTLKSMADLEVPVCGVTLLYKDKTFNYSNKIFSKLDEKIILNIFNQDIIIEIYKYELSGITGHKVPIFFLDTNNLSNPNWVKNLLYFNNSKNQISKDIILGIGGFKLLEKLKFNINKYHLHESNSGFLILELYNNFCLKKGLPEKIIRDKCILSTFQLNNNLNKYGYSTLLNSLPKKISTIPWHIKIISGEKEINLNKLTNYFSSKIFSNKIKTNFNNKKFYLQLGIHLNSWTSKPFKELFDLHLNGWRKDNSILKKAHLIPNSSIYKAHQICKKELIKFVNENSLTNSKLDDEILTIGFARRFIEYKDAELIFEDIENLKKMGNKVQFIFARKSHSKDGIGKDIMKRIIEKSKELNDIIQIAFIENYNIEIAKKLVSGCDLWLNTPIPPNEASGTSGMKAAVNGCMHFSRLDGWAIESFEMNGGGFPISEYEDFYNTLYYKLIPMFYSSNKTIWVENMKLSISNSASYFNTQRMVKEYLEKAYQLNYNKNNN